MITTRCVLGHGTCVIEGCVCRMQSNPGVGVGTHETVDTCDGIDRLPVNEGVGAGKADNPNTPMHATLQQGCIVRCVTKCFCFIRHMSEGVMHAGI